MLALPCHYLLRVLLSTISRHQSCLPGSPEPSCLRCKGRNLELFQNVTALGQQDRKPCALKHACKSAFPKQGLREFITAQPPLLPELSYWKARQRQKRYSSKLIFFQVVRLGLFPSTPHPQLLCQKEEMDIHTSHLFLPPLPSTHFSAS